MFAVDGWFPRIPSRLLEIRIHLVRQPRQPWNADNRRICRWRRTYSTDSHRSHHYRLLPEEKATQTTRKRIFTKERVH